MHRLIKALILTLVLLVVYAVPVDLQWLARAQPDGFLLLRTIACFYLMNDASQPWQDRTTSDLFGYFAGFTGDVRPNILNDLMPSSTLDGTLANLRRPDQFFWDTGQAVTRPRSELADFDIQHVSVRMGMMRSDWTYRMSREPRRFPMFFKAAIDRMAASRGWIRPANAQGARNPFGGPGFQEDVVIFARVDGPGRAAVTVLIGTQERPLRGDVRIVGADVTLSIPTAALVDLGLFSPGVRVIFGIVGPPPESIYDRVPERGAFQLGIASFREMTPAMIKARFDPTGDGKDDLFYLDTNGNGLIDAAARDRNGDGRIVFTDGEGPFLLLVGGATPAEFAEVLRGTSGKRQVYGLANSQFVFLTVVEDKNGDGDVDDEGEFEGSYLAR